MAAPYDRSQLRSVEPIPDAPTAAVASLSRDIRERSGTRASYTSDMTRRRDRERDIVQELQEDTKWSAWTNTFERHRGWGRGSLPRDPGWRTFMLSAVVIVGIVVAVIGLIVLVLTLD